MKKYSIIAFCRNLSNIIFLQFVMFIKEHINIKSLLLSVMVILFFANLYVPTFAKDLISTLDENGTISNITNVSKTILSNNTSVYTLTEVTSDTTVPENAVTIKIDGKTYYYVPNTTDEFTQNDYQRLASTGHIALKELTSSDGAIYKVGEKYYGYNAEKLPQSVYTLTETPSTGDGVITKYEYNKATNTLTSKYYELNLNKTEYGTGGKSYTITINVLGKDIDITVKYNDSTTKTYTNVYTSSITNTETITIEDAIFENIQASSTLIYNNKGTITNLTADFISNNLNISGYIYGGGLIYNSSQSNIVSNLYNINGNIVLNLISADIIYGGGLIGNYSNTTSEIKNIVGDYFSNIVKTDFLAGGGLIGNYSYSNAKTNIENILGDYISNKISGNSFYDEKFINNVIKGGGLIGNYSNASSAIENINCNFISNIIIYDSIYGAGIVGNNTYTESSNSISKIDNIIGDFISNNIYIRNFYLCGGGLIGNYSFSQSSSFNSNSIIKNITGEFISNNVNSKNIYGGGLIGNYAKSDNSNSIAHIDVITGNFLQNYIIGEYIYGGGLIGNYSHSMYSNTNTCIGNITGNFLSNYIESNNIHGGGLIGNYATFAYPDSDSFSCIGDISSNFISNIININGNIYGGGLIGNFPNFPMSVSNSKSTIGDISSNFISNIININGNILGGGLIGNFSNDKYSYIFMIGNIHSNFYKNTLNLISSKYQCIDAGIITNYSFNSTINSIIGNFENNSVIKNKGSGTVYSGIIYNSGTITEGITNSIFKNNYVKIAEGTAYSSVIYTTTDLSINADNGMTLFSGNYTQIGYEDKDYNAVYIDSSSSVLTLNARNKGIIIFDDKITGKLGYTLNIKGDSSSIINIHNTITNANLAISGIGKVNFVDNVAREYNLLSLNSDRNTKYAIDIDLKNQISDKFISKIGSNGVIMIDSLNLFNDVNTTKTYIIQVLKTPNDNIQLAITPELESNSEIGRSIEYGKLKFDKLKSTNNWNTEYKKYQEINGKIYYGNLKLATKETTNDSIAIKIFKTKIFNKEIIQSKWDDTLRLINQSNKFSKKTFSTKDSTAKYIVNTDIGTTKKTLTISGVTTEENQSIIDLNGFNGFIIDNKATLNLYDVTLKGEKIGIGSIINAKPHSVVNIKNITIGSTENGIMNAGTLNLKGSNIFNTSIIGTTGKINIKSGNSILQDDFTIEGNIKIFKSAIFTTSASNILSSINNYGQLNLTGGELSKNILGKGTILIKNDVINNSSLIQNGLIVNQDKTYINKAQSTITKSLINKGIIINTGKFIIKCPRKNNSNAGKITNKGEIFLQYTNFNNDFILNENQSIYGGAIYNQGNLTDKASKFMYNTAENGGAIYNNGVIVIKNKKDAITGGLNNTNFTSNIANENGGAVYNNGSLALSKSALVNNSANNGGAIYNAVNKDATLISTTLLGNIANENGGAIYNAGDLMINKSTVGKANVIKGGVVKTKNSNDAQNGGGVYNSGTMTVSGSKFINNVAIAIKDDSGNVVSGGNGGAIYNTNNANITLTSATLQSNNALNGAGVYNTGNLDIIKSKFTSNIASAVKDESDPVISGVNGGAIYNTNSANLVVNTTTFTSNKAVNGGAIYIQGFEGKKTDDYAGAQIIGSTFKGNSADKGGAIYVGKYADLYIQDTSFTNNIATTAGGAIFADEGSSLYISAVKKNVVFSGNKANGTSNSIHLAEGATLNLGANKGRSITIKDKVTMVGDAVINKYGAGKIYIVNEQDLKTFKINDDCALSTVNGIVGKLFFKTLNLANGTKTIAELDANLKSRTVDKIQASKVVGTGTMSLGKLNIISNSKTPVDINVGKDSVVSSVTTNKAESAEATYKLKSYYDENGMLRVLAYGQKAKPAAVAAPVAAQIGGYLAQINSYDQAFMNMDMNMLVPQSEREAVQNQNRHCEEQSNLAVQKNTTTTQDRDDISYNAKGLWNRPFATFERVNLNNGPKVNNVGYGNYFGGDADMKTLNNSWKRQFSAYIGYNGSVQDYERQSIDQNGGTIGVTEVWYKNRFFTGLTVNAGANVAQASTDIGRENMPMFMAGIASKTGYNFEFKNGKFIVQPSLLISYSFIHTFAHDNGRGSHVGSSPLNAIQVAPGVKFIANLKNGWQPYMAVNMRWNIIDKTHFSLQDVTIPDMSIDPYVEYGVGLQRRWGERFTGFGQAMIRNGGRNGVMLSFGFKWLIGK